MLFSLLKKIIIIIILKYATNNKSLQKRYRERQVQVCFTQHFQLHGTGSDF